MSFRKVALSATFTILLATVPVSADVSGPFLVDNVNQEREILFEGDVRGVVLEVGGESLLIHGSAIWSPPPRESGVWRLGTNETTTARVDLPGSSSLSAPLGVTADGRTLFYTATQQADLGVDTNLFATDGTPAGTRQLTSGVAVADSDPDLYHLSRESGRLYFQEGGFSDTAELWVSDGTEIGTRRIRAFDANRLSLGTEAGGSFFFVVRGFDKNDLYRTDSTAAETVRLHEKVGGGRLHALGGRVVFQTSFPTELFASDGTPGGSVRLFTPEDDVRFIQLVPSGDRIYGWYEVGSSTQVLIVTDGTPAGTRELARFDSSSFLEMLPFSPLAPFGQRSLLFDGYSPETGIEPWVSDGTAAGTRLLADLCPGACSSVPRDITAVAEGVYFLADDGLTGGELYFADSNGSVRRIADLCPGPCSSEPEILASFGDRVYVSARDPQRDREIYTHAGRGSAGPTRLTDFFLRRPFLGNTTATSRGLYFYALLPGEGRTFLYYSDGASSRPVRLLEMPVDTADGSSFPAGFATFGGDLYFTAFDGVDGRSLYRKSGDLPAERLAQIETNGGSRQETAHALRDRLLLLTQEDFGRDRLWSWHPSAPGALELLRQDVEIEGTWTVANRLFFWEQFGSELWVSDGTRRGTRAVAGSVFGQNPAAPLNDRLLFAREGTLWWTDGTEAGTLPAVDLSTLDVSRAFDLLPAGSRVFFIGATGDLMRQVYVTDGTPAGTHAVSPAEVRVDRLVGSKGQQVFFESSVSFDERSLWVTGGSPAEATLLLEDIGELSLLDGRPSSGTLDGELWYVTGEGRIVKTDGTPQRTRFFNSPHFQFPPVFSKIIQIPEHLLLLEPFENLLWVTNNSLAGAAPLQDFPSPGALGSQFHVQGNRVYFAANQSSNVHLGTGVELWALDVTSTEPPPPPRDLAAPRHLRSEGLIGSVFLRWEDVSTGEEHFLIERRLSRAGGDWEAVALAPANATSIRIDPLREPAHLRVRAENSAGVSAWSEVVGAPLGHCHVPHQPTVLCLQDDRFAVEVFWRNEPSGTDGQAVAVPFDFSDDSGTFWFFDEDNIELVVKVLDARVINGHFWNFYGALSTVEYWVVVTDQEGQSNAVYYNPAGNICGRADVRGFPRPDVLRTGGPAAAGRWVPAFRAETPVDATSEGQSACVPDADTLCLTPDRYRVTVAWRDQRSGDTGVGHAIPGTSDSGYFWFFDPANVELVVKVLDARVVNGFVWVFFGALTDVEYTLTVTDTETGESKQYFSRPGNVCGQADVTAFE